MIAYYYINNNMVDKNILIVYNLEISIIKIIWTV